MVTSEIREEGKRKLRRIIFSVVIVFIILFIIDKFVWQPDYPRITIGILFWFFFLLFVQKIGYGHKIVLSYWNMVWISKIGVLIAFISVPVTIMFFGLKSLSHLILWWLMLFFLINNMLSNISDRFKDLPSIGEVIKQIIKIDCVLVFMGVRGFPLPFEFVFQFIIIIVLFMLSVWPLLKRSTRNPPVSPESFLNIIGWIVVIEFFVVWITSGIVFDLKGIVWCISHMCVLGIIHSWLIFHLLFIAEKSKWDGAKKRRSIKRRDQVFIYHYNCVKKEGYGWREVLDIAKQRTRIVKEKYPILVDWIDDEK